ncbi:MAG: DNA (cytosine-5-)-methyltransferase [bacterium]|nr:DNA (cytosine-5-)-methyltransferase [bacterium]
MIADRPQIDRLSVQEVITRADELLELTYRSADLGNLDDPLDEAVYILLSLQTRESIYRQVFSRLKATYGTWEEVLESPVEELVDILRPGGLQERRAATLHLFLLAVAEENDRRGVKGSLSLDFLDGMDDDEVLEFLVGLPGIGPKTARCIMAYSLQREAFAVDTHVRRVLERLEVIERRKGKPQHDDIECLIPNKIRRRFHANLVHHGRAACRSRQARCGECVLVSFCATGQASIDGPCRKPKVVELFAGAGGLGYGFVQAGFRVVLAVDNDRDAAQTYRLNHPGTPVLERDVTRIDEEDIRRFIPNTDDVAVLLAGTPCQGYSLAGRRDPDHPSNRLYEEVARFASLLRPELVVIENVLGLRDVRGVKFVERIRLALTDAGYKVAQPARMKASEYGVSQNRVRFVFLARRADLGEAPPPPPPSHLPPRPEGPLDGELLPRTPTLTETLSDLPDLGPGVELEYGVFEGKPIFNASTMSHAPHVIEKIKKIQPGTGPISYRRLSGTLAKTLIAGHRALPVHPLLDRTISVREAARIQGFPDSFVFAGVRSNQPLQVANAVPPPLARAIAEHLQKYLS